MRRRLLDSIQNGSRTTTIFLALRKGEEADDGVRTRDLKLGKLALYQLSYVRAGLIL
jgi:hypothetical protein